MLIFWNFITTNRFGGFLGGLFGVEGMKKFIGEKESGDYVLPIILALLLAELVVFLWNCRTNFRDRNPIFQE